MLKAKEEKEGKETTTEDVCLELSRSCQEKQKRVKSVDADNDDEKKKENREENKKKLSVALERDLLQVCSPTWRRGAAVLGGQSRCGVKMARSGDARFDGEERRCLESETGGALPERATGDMQTSKAEEEKEREEATSWRDWAMRRLVEEFWVYIHLHRYRIIVVDDASHVGYLASSRGLDLLSSFIKQNSW